MIKKDRPIYLIGGAPTAGKSTVAQLLSNHLQLPWISTDQIRDLVRQVVKRADHPKLFGPEGYSAERFLTEFSAEQIITMEMEQAEAVWSAIKGFITTDFTWEHGFVMEGLSLLPHLINQDFANVPAVKPVFLIDSDADRIRHVVFTRGLWADANTYADSVKEKEVEWTLLFSQKIRLEAEQYGYPTIEVTKSETDLKAVLNALRI